MLINAASDKCGAVSYYEYMNVMRILPILLVAAGLLAGPALAQPQGIAEYVAINDSSVRDGQIVVLTKDGYRISDETYSQNIYGVTTIDPAVAWSRLPKSGTTAVVNNGTTNVLVNDSEGPIALGDWITTSDQRGFGMRAAQPGMVLGRALSELPSGAGSGTVTVSIAPGFATPESIDEIPLSPGAALATLRSGFIVATSGAANFSIRYVLAVLSLLIALGFAFWIFSRTATNSVAAVGRNPLARRSILFVAAVNVGMAIAIVVAGLILAFLILAL